MPREDLDRIVNNVAEIHNADINLYDVTGSLIVSSNPFIYTKGMLSEQMNPLAFYYMNQLNSIEFFNQEKMGGYQFSEYLLPGEAGKRFFHRLTLISLPLIRKMN